MLSVYVIDISGDRYTFDGDEYLDPGNKFIVQPVPNNSDIKAGKLFCVRSKDDIISIPVGPFPIHYPLSKFLFQWFETGALKNRGPGYGYRNPYLDSTLTRLSSIMEGWNEVLDALLVCTILTCIWSQG